MVQFQLVCPFQLLLMLLFHHLQFSVNSALLSLMKSDLFINLKGRIHNLLITVCALQELKLQLIERGAGTVTWVDLYLRPALFFPGRSLLCLETACRACTRLPHKEGGNGDKYTGEHRKSLIDIVL